MNEVVREPMPLIVPSWPAPAGVVALFTTRQGGVSTGRWGDAQGRSGLNLGDNSGDDPRLVAVNRRRLQEAVGLPIRWLRQVHGARVVAVTDPGDAATEAATAETADAQVTSVAGIALGILVADCLPVLFSDRAGRIVGVAHAGWRGLSAGVLENTVDLMRRRRPDADIVAWLGPCIGPAAFEVGEDVLQAFVAHDPEAARHFSAAAAPGKWWADLQGLASRRLRGAGVSSIARADACTVSDAQRFWSHRRDRAGGRMAGVIAIRA